MINVITLYTGSTSNRFTSRQMNYEAINRKAKRGEEHMQSPVYYFITLENVFVSFCEIYLFNSRTNDIQPLVFEHFSSNGFLEDCSIIFSTFGLNTERYSLYSVRMRENTDQNNSEYGHFSLSNSYSSRVDHRKLDAFRIYAEDFSRCGFIHFSRGNGVYIVKYVIPTYFIISICWLFSYVVV